MPFQQPAYTLIEAYRAWMRDAVYDVWARARMLVRGRLLKPDSWTLHNSIFGIVTPDGKIGEVGSNAPHAILWELKGIRGPIVAPPGKEIMIRKRGSLSNRSKFGAIIRQKTYTKTTYKPPVHFLRTALIDEMTGANGQKKLRVLGLMVGYLVLARYIRRLEGQYGGFNVRASTPSQALLTLNVSNKLGLNINASAPSTFPAMDRAVRRAGGTIRPRS